MKLTPIYILTNFPLLAYLKRNKPVIRKLE